MRSVSREFEFNMPWREEYLARAAEAERMAQLVSLGTDKAHFRAIAAKWRSMASGAVRRELA